MSGNANPYESDGEMIGKVGKEVSIGIWEAEEEMDSEDVNRTCQEGDMLHPNAGTSKVSMDMIAKRLIDEKLILTALEMHTELAENGRQLKRLRDFFSNPAHFELSVLIEPPNQLHGTPSIRTVESGSSIDESSSPAGKDIGENEKLAVLEFELRKARDVINTLRRQLTTVSDALPTAGIQTNVCQTDINVDKKANEQLMASYSSVEETYQTGACVLPHEQKAINFLVHEYLLLHNYKLTSVTFSDEVADQDFEDWDEVGLNIPRPSDLLSLYREFSHITAGHFNKIDAFTMTEVEVESDDDLFTVSNTELISRLNEENSQLLQKNEQLSEEIERMDCEIEKYKNELEEMKQDMKCVKSGKVPVEVPSSTDEKSLAIQCRTAPLIFSLQGEAGIERNRYIPKSFEQFVREQQFKYSPTGEDVQLLSEISSVASTVEQLVPLLSSCLLRVVPNVLVAKRDQLLPLIVSTAVLSTNSDDSDKLISILLNLVKRPDERQRRLIGACCETLCRLGGEKRVEGQLLPHCWQQMGHKYVERRLLIAHICGALCPHLNADLVSSLLLSMLQQMVTDDISEEVREAAVISLANLCLYVEDRDKFNQICEIVERSCFDRHSLVVSAAQRLLLPSFAIWADTLDQFYLAVISIFLRKLLHLLKTSGVNQTANETVICNYIACLKSVTSILFWSVVRTGLYETLVDDSADIKCVNYLDQLLSESDPGFCQNKRLFQEHTSQEWFTSWHGLDYVSTELLPQLVSILDLLEPNLPRTVAQFVDYFRDFCHLFGRGFCISKVRPIFTPSLTVPKAFSELTETEQSACGIGRATLPVYCAGVISAFDTTDDWLEVRRFVRWKMVSVVQCAAPTAAIGATFSHLCRCWPERQEALVQMVWECVAQTDVRLRCLSAEVLSRLALEVGLCLIRSKIVPALITLAADSHPSIRIGSVAGFLNVIQASGNDDDLMDKMKMQLSSMFDDVDPSVVSHLTRLISQSVPSMDAHFRDEFVVMHLARLVEKMDMTGREGLVAALFDAYSAVSCCFISPLSNAHYFIPGLRRLITFLDPCHMKVAQSILKDAEAKLPQSTLTSTTEMTAPRRDSSSLGEGVEGMRSKMVSTIKDIKGRVDFPKDAVPSLFRKKPN